MASVATELKNNPEYRYCIGLILQEYAKDHPGYFGGRTLGAGSVAALAGILSPQKKVRPFLSKLGISMGTSTSFGVYAGIGDFGSHVAQGKNIATGVIPFATGDEFNDEDIPCECRGVMDEIEDRIRNEILERALDGFQ